jgi:RsiW-degrading membrane proteinase PrsW (M82 family)
MDDRCRIGNEPATRSLGAYRFCERHYERALRQRGSLWRADIVSLVALGLFVLLVYALDAALNPRLDTGSLLIVGTVIAIVPTIIWLAFFYRWDRLEPEPKTLVIRVGVLAALAAAAVGIPLVEGFFDVGSWLNRGVVTQILGNILVIGFVQMGLVYLVVRLSVYESAEFDEWTDGILYGTAAGIGLATVINIEFILGSGGADLGLAAIRVALTALVLASLGGLVGYFLGHDRLEVRPIWYVPAGVALAAVLNGIFWYLRSSLSGGLQGGISTTWIGLILAAVLAGIVTWFLAMTVRNELRRALAAGTRVEGVKP